MRVLTKAQIDQRLSQLPEVLREAIFDYDHISVLGSLDQNFHLHTIQSKKLSQIFGRVLMGFIPLSDLLSELKTSLNLDDSTASRIADVLNRQIFNSLRDELVKLNSQLPTSGSVSANVLNLKRVAPSSIPAVSAREPITPRPAPKIFPVAPSASFSTPPPPLVSPFSSPLPPPPPPAVPRPLVSASPHASFHPTPPSPAPSSAPALDASRSAPSAPVQKDFIRPTRSSAPFVLHRESTIVPINPPVFNQSASPQIFDSDNESSAKPPAPAARVEIGTTYRSHRKQQTATTARLEPAEKKLIDYSAFPTPTDPFAALNANKSNPNSNSDAPRRNVNEFARLENASPEPDLSGNVINLKPKT